MNRTVLRRALIPLILTYACLSIPSAGVLPSGSPEKAGFSRGRFERIVPVMQKYVDEGKVAGMITMVARRGTLVHLETYGVTDHPLYKKVAGRSRSAGVREETEDGTGDRES